MENTAKNIGYLVIATIILGLPALWVVSLIYWNPAITILIGGVVLVEWFCVFLALGE